jgi:hypothetical protein
MTKNNMKSWVGTWLTPSLVIGGIVAGAFYVGDFKKDSDTRMFESASQKEKTRSHIDSDYNEVRNYQLMEEQKQMKVQLDTAYAWVNARFKEDIAKRNLDSVNKSKAILSRQKRDSIFESQANTISEMEREQRITSNAIQLILQKIEEVKKEEEAILDKLKESGNE